MALPPQALESGARPGWVRLYRLSMTFGTPSSSGVKAGGAPVHRAARHGKEIPGIGRFAMVADPQGAAFHHDEADPAQCRAGAYRAGAPGTPGWHELHAADGTSAFELLRGPVSAGPRRTPWDMGPMGPTNSSPPAGRRSARWMIQVAAGEPIFPLALHSNVEAIKPGGGTRESHGGQVLKRRGRTRCPARMWVLQASDPQTRPVRPRRPPRPDGDLRLQLGEIGLRRGWKSAGGTSVGVGAGGGAISLSGRRSGGTNLGVQSNRPRMSSGDQDLASQPADAPCRCRDGNGGGDLPRQPRRRLRRTTQKAPAPVAPRPRRSRRHIRRHGRPRP